MKILHLASEYASGHVPTKIYGLGRFVHGLARAQAALGDEVHVLTNSHGGAEDQVLREGVRVHRIAFPNPPRPSEGHGEVLQWNHGVMARLLDRRAEFANVDVIVGHDWLSASAAREAALALERPLALVVHDEAIGKHAGVLSRDARFARDMEALAVHDSNLVIANSHYIARQVVRHYRVPAERVVTIHGGIDPAFGELAPSEHQEDFRRALVGDGQLLVTYVGRLDPEKGLGVLAEAIERVSEQLPGIRFVIAGTGRRERGLVAALGGRARLLGYVRGEPLVRLYRASDVVVVPSVYEPFGLVALEAMLCGTAVVVARTGGLPEIVRDGVDGVVVAPGDAQALADGLLGLARDHVARAALAVAGQRRALGTFDWKAIAKASREAYSRLAGAAPVVLTAPPVLPPRGTISAVVVVRDHPERAESALRSLLLHVPGLLEVVLLDHGSSLEVSARLGHLVGALGPGSGGVSLVRANRSVTEDQALLEAVEATSGACVFVVQDVIEALPGEEGLLDGLYWLLEDAAAASVSPTLVNQDRVGRAVSELAEQRRAADLPQAAFLARRKDLLQALARAEGDLGPRLREVCGGGHHWTHALRMASAERTQPQAFAHPSLSVGQDLPASLVILAYDNLALTRDCLESVLAHTPPPFELVLVDNGSRDETRALFQALRAQLGPERPVQVIENDHNLGFPAGANQGIRAARGRHVVVLNNDTRVCPGWLQSLLAAAESEPQVGVVTSKVLNLDLSVQSAGGILHAPDGSFTIPGQGASRTNDSVRQRRRVSNAGGPCLLLTRSLLDRIAPGGAAFDEAYSPGYFEDSDLCLRAREAGFTLLYEPGAEVIHHGKATASLVASEGRIDVWRRFEANRQRFYARWREQLARDHSEFVAPGPLGTPQREVGT